MPALERSSTLPLAADRVWARVVTPEGVNHELSPILRMTTPGSLRGRTIDDVPLGEPLGRSWLLLGRILPVDFDDLCLSELEPGRRFAERSRTLSFSPWEHERIIETTGHALCRVTDRLRFELRPTLRRVPFAGRLATTIVGALFTHRHRRLRAWASSVA